MKSLATWPVTTIQNSILAGNQSAPEINPWFGHCAITPQPHFKEDSQSSRDIKIANNDHPPNTHRQERWMSSSRHCRTWNRGEVYSDCLKQWVGKHSGADQSSLEKREWVAMRALGTRIWRGNIPGRELCYCPQVGRQWDWHLGLKGAWSSSILVGGKTSPSSPTRSSLLPLSCRDLLNPTPFPLPTPSPPFSDPFSFYPEFTWIKMLWEIEPWDLLHPKSIRKGQTILAREKYNDVWKSAEKRNYRQNDRSVFLFRELAFETEKQNKTNKQKVLLLKLEMVTFQFYPGTAYPSLGKCKLARGFSPPFFSPPLLSPQTLPPLSGHHLTPSGYTASSCTRWTAFIWWLVKILVHWQVSNISFETPTFVKLRKQWVFTFKSVFLSHNLREITRDA